MKFRFNGLHIVLLALAISGCGGDDDRPRKITGSYEVEVGRSVIGASATAPTQPQDEAVVTYRTSNGTQQTRTVGGKFSTLIVVEEGDFMYVSAQRGSGNASVTAKISLDGQDFKKITSFGSGAIATASGSCCKK